MHKDWHNVRGFRSRVGGIPVTISDFVRAHMNTAHTRTCQLSEKNKTKQRSLLLTVQPRRQSGDWHIGEFEFWANCPIKEEDLSRLSAALNLRFSFMATCDDIDTCHVAFIKTLFRTDSTLLITMGCAGGQRKCY